MKVAVWHDLHSGGGKRALRDHLTGLVAAGHEIEIWTPCTKDQDFASLSQFGSEHVDPIELSDFWSVNERAGITRRSVKLIAAMDEHCRRSARHMQEVGCDVLFANSSYRVAVSSIGRFCKLPSLIYHQEPTRSLFEASPDFIWKAPNRIKLNNISKSDIIRRFSQWRHKRNGRIQLRDENENIRSFNKVLCNSLFSRESMLRAYGVEAEVCYLGIDTNQFFPRQLPKGTYVIGLGSFYASKNPRLCIEAIGSMKGLKPKLIWICNIKDDKLVGDLTAAANLLGLDLEIKTAIPDEELFVLLSGALAMIYTSRLEPFGLAPLEANACGTAVIAVAEGGVRETIQDGVNGIMTVGTVNSLAAAITRLRDNPQLASTLGHQGARMVTQLWSQEAAAERLVTALTNVYNGY